MYQLLKLPQMKVPGLCFAREVGEKRICGSLNVVKLESWLAECFMRCCGCICSVHVQVKGIGQHWARDVGGGCISDCT